MDEAARKSAPCRLPGLVDLQVNGWDGIDFNAPGLTVGKVEQAASALREQGVVAFLPTVVTNAPALMEESLRILAESAVSATLAGRMIAGIHLEGPFVSALDGPRGAHPREHVREPDLALVERLRLASGGLLRILTFAPELPGAVDLVRWCISQGIVAAIGHSAGDAAAIAKAVEAGARLSTHLGNGCASQLPRHPNLIWDQLAEDRLFATMIADGHHLPEALMRVFLRTKGEKLMLISDATALGGAAPGEYRAHIGGNVVLRPDGRLHVQGSPGLLAGAALPLLQGVLTLVDRGIASLETAWDLGSTRPARFLGMDEAPGSVLFDPATRRILETKLGSVGRWKP